MHWYSPHSAIAAAFPTLLLLTNLVTSKMQDPTKPSAWNNSDVTDDCTSVDLAEPNATEYTVVVSALRRRLPVLYAAEVDANDFSQFSMQRLSHLSWKLQLSATTLWSVTLHSTNKSIRSSQLRAFYKSPRLTNTSRRPLDRNVLAVVFRPPTVDAYLVGPLPRPTRLQLVSRIAYLKRPLGSVEYGALLDFLTILCADIDEVLRMAYSASFFVQQPSISWLKMAPDLNVTTFKRLENESLCQPTGISQKGVNGDPSCLIPIFASPLITRDAPGRRITCFRLVRQVAPLIQYPIDMQFNIDHTSLNPLEWTLESLWFQHQFYASTAELLQAYLMGKLKIYKIPFVDLYPGQLEHKLRVNTFNPMQSGLTKTSSNITASPSNQNKMVKSLKQLDSEDNLGHQKQTAFQRIQVCGSHVRYRHWEFHFTVRRDTGLRAYDIRFDGNELVAEAGLDETVTAYWSSSPFMQKMTSVESMFGVGAMASELAPGLDCPKDAIFVPITLVPSGEVGPRLIKRGVCFFEWSVDTPGGPIYRHFEFSDTGSTQTAGSSSPNGHTNFGHGVPSRGLVVRMISSLFNYDYLFDMVLHSSGAVEFAVTPTGYVHVHNLRPKWHGDSEKSKAGDELAFGYPSGLFDIGLTIHQHLFNFKVDVDVVQERNVFKVVDIHGPSNNPSKPQRRALWMEQRIIYHEADALFTPEFDKPKQYLICQSDLPSMTYPVDSTPPRHSHCLSFVNSGAVKTLLSDEHTKSFAWARHPLVVTRQRDNETYASSPFNGVDLTDPVVDFTKFTANNDSLYGEDLVLWVTVGNYHLPRQEDLPNTVTSGGRLSFRLMPHNLFQYNPTAHSCQRFFTNSIKEWLKGPVEANDCTPVKIPKL